MNYVELIRKDSNRLFVTTLVLFAGALLSESFPILSFIIFAPLFAMLDKPNGFRDSYRLLIIVPIVGLLVYFVLEEGSTLSVVLYSILVFILFWGLAEVHRIRQNVLNKFALVIFLLGAEYIVVKYIPAHHGVFLADLVSQKPEWIRWNIYTGYLGSSLWILSANLIFYQAIFKSDSIKKWTLLMAILFILLPIIYSLNLSNPAITRMDMTLLYSQGESESTYSRNGELISRTGAWVSVLIVIFTFVKSKTKQKHK
jgi:hypothetical protein